METTATQRTVDYGPAEAVLGELGRVEPGDLIPLLQRLQDAYGYLPSEVLQEVSRRTGIPVSRMYGVATFYEQFHLEPRGRHTVRVCRGTACHVRGAPDVLAAVVQAMGVTEGETTEDRRYTLETVACLGTCFLAPVMMVDKDYHGKLKLGNIPKILKKYK
jgi:NADH:ubiquinone oxidoreductase subunit E